MSWFSEAYHFHLVTNLRNDWLEIHRQAEQDLESYFLISRMVNLEQQATGNVGKVEMTRKSDNMPGSVTVPWKVPSPWPAKRLILSGLSKRQCPLALLWH